LVDNNTPVDATHFHRFQDAYNVAAANDTIQIEPGAFAGSIGAGVTGNGLGGGAKNTSTITIDNPNIGAGEWIMVKGGGGLDETVLVTAVTVNPNGTSTLSVAGPFAYDHSGPGAFVKTEGKLGIDRPLTLRGDPNVQGQPNFLGLVTSDIMMPY